MEYNSGEIEIAIKIGQIKLTGSFTASYGGQVRDFITYITLLGVDMFKDAIYDSQLSPGIRTIVAHRGDISYERFFKSINWDSAYEVKCVAAFLLGIGYIYPVTSMFYNKHFSFDNCLPIEYQGSSNIEELYKIARNIYIASEKIIERYKDK